MAKVEALRATFRGLEALPYELRFDMLVDEQAIAPVHSMSTELAQWLARLADPASAGDDDYRFPWHSALYCEAWAAERLRQLSWLRDLGGDWLATVPPLG